MFTKKVFNKDECVDVESLAYNLNLKMTLERNELNYKVGNMSIKAIFYENNESFQINKIFFFSDSFFIIDLFKKILLFPFNFFGFYKNDEIKIEIIDKLDFYEFSIRQIDLIIDSSVLFITKAVLTLEPKVTFTQRLLANTKFISIPLIYLLILSFQIVIFSFLKINKNKFKITN